MVNEIDIVSTLAPSVLLTRLVAYGKEWRESKIPPAVRAKGVHGCSIAVSGSRFSLRLHGQGGGLDLVWRGEVLSTPDATGSRLRALPKFSRLSNVLVAAFYSFLIGAMALPALAREHFSFLMCVVVVAAVGVMSVPLIAQTAYSTATESVLCGQILRHVAAVDEAVPQRAM